MKDKIILLVERIEKYKKSLQDNPILIDTTLSVLKYLQTEKISEEQKKWLFHNLHNTIKIIEEKIDRIESNENSIKKGKRRQVQ